MQHASHVSQNVFVRDLPSDDGRANTGLDTSMRGKENDVTVREETSIVQYTGACVEPSVLGKTAGAKATVNRFGCAECHHHHHHHHLRGQPKDFE